MTYVAGNIDVGDEQELTRSYQGEAVETVLRDLAFKSNNEDFGVNDDLEFFFRERETVHIDRGIDNTQWFNYDIPELGRIKAKRSNQSCVTLRSRATTRIKDCSDTPEVVIRHG